MHLFTRFRCTEVKWFLKFFYYKSNCIQVLSDMLRIHSWIHAHAPEEYLFRNQINVNQKHKLAGIFFLIADWKLATSELVNFFFFIRSYDVTLNALMERNVTQRSGSAFACIGLYCELGTVILKCFGYRSHAWFFAFNYILCPTCGSICIWYEVHWFSFCICAPAKTLFLMSCELKQENK